MKLWLLTAKQDDPIWAFPYDKKHGHVIRAETEESARGMASTSVGDEGRDAWLDSAHSTCDELFADGPPEIVLTDFCAG